MSDVNTEEFQVVSREVSLKRLFYGSGWLLSYSLAAIFIVHFLWMIFGTLTAIFSPILPGLWSGGQIYYFVLYKVFLIWIAGIFIGGLWKICIALALGFRPKCADVFCGWSIKGRLFLIHIALLWPYIISDFARGTGFEVIIQYGAFMVSAVAVYCFWLAPLFVVDRGLSGGAALRASATHTTQHFRFFAAITFLCSVGMYLGLKIHWLILTLLFSLPFSFVTAYYLDKIGAVETVNVVAAPGFVARLWQRGKLVLVCIAIIMFFASCYLLTPMPHGGVRITWILWSMTGHSTE